MPDKNTTKNHAVRVNLIRAHGTLYRYQYGLCRCSLCLAANQLRQAKYPRKRKDYWCIVCGKPILRVQGQHHRSHKYCGEECKLEALRDRQAEQHGHGRRPREARPCAICGSLFYPRRNSQVICDSKGECARIHYKSKEKRKNHEKARANPRICLGCGSSFVPLGNDKRRKYCSRRCAHLHRRCLSYGITLVEYRRILEAQHHQCAICAKPIDETLAASDHDHATGTFRGIICGQCNTAIGLFADDVERMRRAIEYLGGTLF